MFTCRVPLLRLTHQISGPPWIESGSPVLSTFSSAPAIMGLSRRGLHTRELEHQVLAGFLTIQNAGLADILGTSGQGTLQLHAFLRRATRRPGIMTD